MLVTVFIRCFYSVLHYTAGLANCSGGGGVNYFSITSEFFSGFFPERGMKTPEWSLRRDGKSLSSVRCVQLSLLQLSEELVTTFQFKVSLKIKIHPRYFVSASYSSISEAIFTFVRKKELY